MSVRGKWGGVNFRLRAGAGQFLRKNFARMGEQGCGTGRKLAGKPDGMTFWEKGLMFPPATTQSQCKIKFIMENKIIRECVSFDHSLVFANANSADIPATSKGAAYVTSLTGIYGQLVKAGATQKPVSVSAQNALILALDKKLDILATIARACAADVPGFADSFPRPAHFNPGEVLRTANVYLAALVPAPADDAATVAAKAARVQVFVDHAQPATLVADLQAQVQAVGTVSGTHEASREEGVLSTAQIAGLVGEGRKQRNYLDAIFQTVYANIPEKLAAWNSASHVEHSPHHPAVTPTPAPTSTATK